MIMKELLSATQVQNEFSQFVDSIIHQKPIAVKRNDDIFWSFSKQIAEELLAGYTLAIEYENEEDGSFFGSLVPLEDIVVHGKTMDDMIEDAAIQLVEYAQEYYQEFNKYYNAPNRRSHLPYILNVLSQNDIEGVKKLING